MAQSHLHLIQAPCYYPPILLSFDPDSQLQTTRAVAMTDL